MKLVYIVNGINGPGGLERVLSIKASMLAEVYNYDVQIITLNQNNDNLFYDFSSKIKYHNVDAKGNSLLYACKYIFGLRKIIKRLKPDIISVCDDGLKGFLVPLFLKKTCPMVYERHVSKNIEIKKGKNSTFNKITTGFKFWFMNFGGNFYDAFIVLTKGNLNEWKFKNLKVIPNPLSFYPQEQSSLKNKKVLAVGKQSFQKGYDRLLKSWEIVVKKHPNWTLDIYGTFDEKEGLNKLANDLNISKSVCFYKPVKNIAKKYKQASIYAMSSRYEGFGMVLTEAMAYGVPCVSFNCPYGPSDIITHHENGILVENHDIEGLAKGINYLIENVNTRHAFGKKARKDVQRYLPENIVAKWDDLFKNLIMGKQK